MAFLPNRWEAKFFAEVVFGGPCTEKFLIDWCWWQPVLVVDRLVRRVDFGVGEGLLCPEVSSGKFFSANDSVQGVVPLDSLGEGVLSRL